MGTLTLSKFIRLSDGVAVNPELKASRDEEKIQRGREVRSEKAGLYKTDLRVTDHALDSQEWQ